MALTLAELKEQNRIKEEEEAKAAEEAEKPEESTKTPESEETQTEATDVEETQESEGEESEASEDTELWMQTEEQTSEGDAKFTDGDVANLRRKLKAKIQKEKDEIEDLRAEIAALRNQIQSPEPGQVNQAPAQAPANTGMPTLEDFDYDTEKYNQAVGQWTQTLVNQAVQSVQQQTSQQAIQTQEAQLMQKSVEGHYQRAADLVKESNIDPDVYKNA